MAECITNVIEVERDNMLLEENWALFRASFDPEIEGLCKVFDSMEPLDGIDAAVIEKQGRVLLLAKGQNLKSRDLLEALRKEGCDCIVEKALFADISDRTLARLALATLSKEDSWLFSRPNLVGGCILTDLAWNKAPDEEENELERVTLEITIDQEMALFPAVRTFGRLSSFDAKSKAWEKARFVFSPTGRVVRAPKSCPIEDCYVIRRANKRPAKHSVKWLSLEEENIAASKVIALNVAIRTINESFGDALKLQFRRLTNVETMSVASWKRKLSVDDMGQKIGGAVNIVDLTNDAQGKQAVEAFRLAVREYAPSIDVKTTRKQVGKLPSILIVHEKDHYEKGDKSKCGEDPYRTGSGIIQHVSCEQLERCLAAKKDSKTKRVRTFEERVLGGKRTNKVRELCFAVFSELAIAKDLSERNLTLFDMAADELEEVVWIEQDKRNKDTTALSFKPDGTIEVVNMPRPFAQVENERALLLKKTASAQVLEKTSGVMALKWKDEAWKAFSFEITEQRPLPTDDYIDDARVVDPSFCMPAAKLLIILAEVAENVRIKDESLEELEEKLRQAGDMQVEVASIVNSAAAISTKLGPSLSNAIKESEGVLTRLYGRDKTTTQRWLPGHVGFNYAAVSDNDGESCLLYWMGQKPNYNKGDFGKSTKIRKVRNLTPELKLTEKDIEFIAASMDVGFVRKNQPTAMPFFAKYVREYIAKFSNTPS